MGPSRAMKIFMIRTLGDFRNTDLCVVNEAPRGIGVKYSRLALGRSIAADFPTDATVHMSADQPGLKLSSLLGNTKRFLIVNRDVKEIVAAEHVRRGDLWPIEYLPFTLINQKGRTHSTDYFFINPLGTVDCVNHKASDIVYFEGDLTMVLEIKRMVLDPDKLKGAPPLFRLPQAEDRYFVDEDLKRALDERKLTNLYLDEIEVLPDASRT